MYANVIIRSFIGAISRGSFILYNWVDELKYQKSYKLEGTVEVNVNRAVLLTLKIRVKQTN